MGDIVPRPMILIRGFGGPDVSGEQRSAYQGFNDGTVYAGKRGENYIYEGFLLRAMKSDRYPTTTPPTSSATTPGTSTPRRTSTATT
jgi:hypothetical protein